MKRMSKIVLALGVVALAVGPAWGDDGAGKPEGKTDDYTRGLLDCSNAMTIYCGDVVTGDNSGSPMNVDLYSCSSWNEAGPEDVYIIDLAGYTELTITIADLQEDLDVFLLTDCDEAACTAYGNTTINGEFNPGTYYIVVDGYDGAVSTYTLTVECADVPPPPEEDGSICNFMAVCYDWDFTQGDQGFVPVECDPTSTNPVWQWGAETLVPGSPGNVWATVLNGNYVNYMSEGLASPPFTVTPECDWMEIKHYVYTEGYITGTGNIYDGVNVTVDDMVIPPFEGYTGVVNMGTAPCVYGEEVFAGDAFAGKPIRTWGKSCFDLSQFLGMTIRVRFDVGSDGSVTRPGWYLEYVKIGHTTDPVPTERQTWGTLKALYR